MNYYVTDSYYSFIKPQGSRSFCINSPFFATSRWNKKWRVGQDCWSDSHHIDLLNIYFLWWCDRSIRCYFIYWQILPYLQATGSCVKMSNFKKEKRENASYKSYNAYPVMPPHLPSDGQERPQYYTSHVCAGSTQKQ